MDSNFHERTEHIRVEAIPVLQTSLVLEFRNYWTDYNKLHSCTVHFDSIKSFICPTSAHKLL